MTVIEVIELPSPRIMVLFPKAARLNSSSGMRGGAPAANILLHFELEADNFERTFRVFVALKQLR